MRVLLVIVFILALNYQKDKIYPMEPVSNVVIEECIYKLQGLLGAEGTSKPVPVQSTTATSATSSSTPAVAGIPQLDANLALCLAKANSICPELTKLVP